MKTYLKNSASVFGRIVFANVICIFICISISVLCTAIFTHNIGYKAYGTLSSDSSSQTVSSNEETKELYTYNYSAGEDTKKAEYEEKGYTITTQKFRSDMTKGGNVAYLIIAQVFCLLILNTFIYSEVWHIGTTDNNKVHFGRIKQDKFKGLKIGVIATIPIFIMYIGLLVLKFAYPNFPLIIYKFLNCSLYSFLHAIFGSNIVVGDLGAIRMVLILLVMFIPSVLSQIAYTLGYKQISLSEKLIYKKKKNK